jgi:hypothetical protein
MSEDPRQAGGERGALAGASISSFVVCGWLREKLDALNRQLKLPQSLNAHPKMGNRYAVGDDVVGSGHAREADGLKGDVGDTAVEPEIGGPIEIDERCLSARYGRNAASNAGYVLDNNRSNESWLIGHDTIPSAVSRSLDFSRPNDTKS